jgi:hypothetical protein
LLGSFDFGFESGCFGFERGELGSFGGDEGFFGGSARTRTNPMRLCASAAYCCLEVNRMERAEKKRDGRGGRNVQGGRGKRPVV